VKGTKKKNFFISWEISSFGFCFLCCKVPHLGKSEFLVMKLAVACMENDGSRKVVVELKMKMRIG